MAPGRMLDRVVIIREPMPEDLKLEIEQFSPGVVGKAHGRRMAICERKAWRHPPDSSVPSWLWTTVVSLLARHEAAYLEH